jgi:hypothetical protein
MAETRGSRGASADRGAAAQLAALQNERVEDWLAMIRQADIVPAAVERSLSWRLTRPVRLGQTAVRVLRRDGAGRFWATVLYRLRRLASRR